MIATTISQNITMKPPPSSDALRALAAACAANAFASSGGRVSSLPIASTPASIPPGMSPALKWGVMSLRMIWDDSASVMMPSRP
ncbi:hypothetical protein BV95_04395 [Sphingobium chlorophenolicum]|uniref:Uncharacterized protein n=1 Tax=Sphingobium chlorophenolicum TaxID=46429 RepID=A0A081R810_SPHCR|nr:hypothetical protein BV95_04395 [Sphingobium chlorophenolicum]